MAPSTTKTYAGCTNAQTGLPTERDLWKAMLDIRVDRPFAEVTGDNFLFYLNAIPPLFRLIAHHPYCLPLYVLQAQIFSGLGYPDLAAGGTYKALLLSTSLSEESDEYHCRATESLAKVIEEQPRQHRVSLLRRAASPNEGPTAVEGRNRCLDIELSLWLNAHYLPLVYRVMAKCLVRCGCFKSASEYVALGLRFHKGDEVLQGILRDLQPKLVDQLAPDEDSTLLGRRRQDPSDRSLVRREVYPWNDREPDRLNGLLILNTMMAEVAPKLEVRTVGLPTLTQDSPGMSLSHTVQLGVFAKEDLVPGEIMLNERSMLTANNKLQDALCDACSAPLPGLTEGAEQSAATCHGCEVVFCSALCRDEAWANYHKALCGKDIEAINKDVEPEEAANALYTLLLLRTLAMAETQQCHPLELKEVKYIWGDFDSNEQRTMWRPASADDRETMAGFPRRLPFDFEHNVKLPFHLLEKMDVDIFASPQYDVWVFNTLYAKYRGTASARLSGLDGRTARGPEVSAVHPLWCLANHSCNPNASWEWGGSIKLWAREERPVWRREDGQTKQSPAGVRMGEQIYNHYCDVTLPVRARREWARGALGGDCQCERCIWELDVKKHS